MSTLKNSQTIGAQDAGDARDAPEASQVEIVEMPRLRKPKYGKNVRETTIDLPDIVQRTMIEIMYRENDDRFNEVMTSAKRVGQLSIGAAIEGPNVHAGFYVDNVENAPQGVTVSLVNFLTLALFYHKNSEQLLLKPEDEKYKPNFELSVIPQLIMGGKKQALETKYHQLLSQLDLLECSHARYTFTLPRLVRK